MLTTLLGISVLLLNVADSLSTWVALRQYGNFDQEANPLAVWLFTTIGFWPTVLVKVVVLSAGIGWLLVSPRVQATPERRMVRFATLVMLTCFLGLVVTNNLCHVVWRKPGLHVLAEWLVSTKQSP